MIDFIPQVSRFDAWQGRNEQRSEAYVQNVERAAEFLTQPDAKSVGGADSFAGRQVNAARRLWNEV